MNLGEGEEGGEKSEKRGRGDVEGERLARAHAMLRRHHSIAIASPMAGGGPPECENV